MSKINDKVIERWLGNVLGYSDRRNLRGANVFGADDQFYSYGYHFTLAQAIRNEDGKVCLFLLNGDRYSVTTTRHQADTLSAIKGSGLPFVTIPFAALDAAGIDHKTVRLHDRSNDRNETIDHRTRVQPEGSVWREDPISDHVDLTADELQAICDKRTAEAMESWEDKHQYARDENISMRSYWQNWVENSSVAAYPYEVTIDQLGGWTKRQWRQVGTEWRLYGSSRRGAYVIDVSKDDQGTLYTWTTYRHWLGESLISGEIRHSRREKCKSCYGRGHRSKVAPDRYSAEGWCKKCRGHGVLQIDESRRAKFLSGFDHQERRALYFLCELPETDAETIAEAYEALKPETVKLAELAGRTVRRQGDIFAIELTDMTKRQLTKLGARHERRGFLLGTNHRATEVAYLPDGRTLARGTMTHDPGRFRDPDHARVTIGKNWHLVCKNTVPITV